MDGIRFSVLYLGRMECKKLFLVDCQDEQEMIKSPVSALLIQHPTMGNILVDTGNSPYYHGEYSRETLETYPIVEYISIEAALAEKGLTVNDIDMIVLTHLHFDHAGGLRYFAGTKAIQHVIVAEEELKNAWFSVMTGNSGAYVKRLFDVEGMVCQTYRDQLTLGDGLTLFAQKCHTPACTGLVIRTGSGRVVIDTSDTVYTRESFEKRIAPGGHINKTRSEFFENLDRLTELQKRCGGEFLFGHDYEQICTYSRQGWIE